MIRLGFVMDDDVMEPMRDRRREGFEFGGETQRREDMEWGDAKSDLMRDRWATGLDIWTGEPAPESEFYQGK